MKKILSILLLLLLSHHLLLSVFVFKVVQLQTKNKASERIQEEEDGFLSLSIPFSELNNPAIFSWEEEGKEFTYRGQWYDVADYKVKEDRIDFECFLDEEERKTVENFKNQHSSDKSFFSFFSSDFIPFPFIVLIPPIGHYSSMYCQVFVCLFPTIALPQLSPPPKMIV